MSEPQIWSIIGVMAAGLFGVLGLMSTMFTRVIRSEIQGVHTEIGGLHNEMVARFDGMDKRIDNLDQDVQYLMKREIER